MNQTLNGKDALQGISLYDKEIAPREASTLEIAVTTPGPRDVLLGRGTPFSEYCGNLKVRELVKERQAEYAKTSTRDEKHQIAVDIARETRARGGRFLRCIEGTKDSKSSKWEVVQDEKEVTQKIKQMIRDMAPRSIQRRQFHRDRRLAEKSRARFSFAEARTKRSGASPASSTSSEDSSTRARSPKETSCISSMPSLSPDQVTSFLCKPRAGPNNSSLLSCFQHFGAIQSPAMTAAMTRRPFAVTPSPLRMTSTDHLISRATPHALPLVHQQHSYYGFGQQILLEHELLIAQQELWMKALLLSKLKQENLYLMS
eukprot:scaffold7475_cov174-Amphora_coffeaeformis.AAC.4